jgi:hypothetical protein
MYSFWGTPYGWRSNSKSGTMNGGKPYNELSKHNNLLKALASRPGNEEAFAKLNDKPILQTEYEYKDETLDDRGDNRYFYRIRPIDEIGNLGPFSVATLPV